MIPVAATIDASDGHKWGSDQWVKQQKMILTPIEVPEVMATLLSSTAGISRPGNAVTEHETYIPMSFAEEIPSYSMITANTGANGLGVTKELAPTLDRAQPAAIAQPISFDLAQITSKTNRSRVEPGLPVSTISKGSDMHVVHGTQDPCVSDSHAFALGRNNGGENVLVRPINIYGGNKRTDRPEGGFYVRMNEDTSKTLDAATGLNPTCSQGGTAVLQPIGIDEECNARVDGFGSLLRGGQGGTRQAVMQINMAVRRLTPVECERLQGFPDNYTDIKPKGKPTPDGPRYKALGNSWAVPVVRWIGERIMAYEAMK